MRINPTVIGIKPPTNPDIPHIMADKAPKPPAIRNPGIVPPWLQRAAQDYTDWTRATQAWDYEPGSYPFDFGMTVEEVANQYELGYHKEN